jgi:UDP-hydrolysing UDP-N-acetyl-D-glucosamine 2-epimerase
VTKRIAVLTSGRQDWGILRSTCLLLRDDERFDLRLLVGGMHCVAAFGQTERNVAADGFEVAERLDWIAEGASVTEESGAAMASVGAALRRQEPAALLLVGDRFETAAAAVAATIAGVPIVHLHGGEETEGAIDNALRHSITKLSHLHLTSHPNHRDRVVAIGEDPATVHVVGAPGLDNLHRDDLPDQAALEADLGRALPAPLVVVTVHPTTLRNGHASTGSDIRDPDAGAVASAMTAVPANYVVTLPNNDPGHAATRSTMVEAAAATGGIAVEALGERRFWGLLRSADAILGNSSSALIEAAALGVPAVNVGQRQQGRLRGENVLDVPDGDPDRVIEALRTALDPTTRQRLSGTSSPYGDGRSAARIISILADWTPPNPPRKAPIAVERRSA